MIRENDIENYFIKEMKDIGALCLKWISPEKRGVPEQIVIYRGLTFFVELKAPGEKLRKSQKRFFKKMRENKAEVQVLSTKEDVNEFVDAVLYEYEWEKDKLGCWIDYED